MRRDGGLTKITHGLNTIVIDRVEADDDAIFSGEIRMRTVVEGVHFLAGGKILEMSTPVAIKVGLAMCENARACIETGDHVRLSVNGHALVFLPYMALDLGGRICKRADRADDWQRGLIPSNGVQAS